MKPTKRQRAFFATPRGQVIAARKERNRERKQRMQSEFEERSRRNYQWFVEKRDRLADADLI